MSPSRRLVVGLVYCALVVGFKSIALAVEAPRCTRNLDGPTFPMPMVGPALNFTALLSLDSDGDGTSERYTFAGYPVRQLVRLEYTATGQVVPHDAVVLSKGSYYVPPLAGDVDGDGTVDVIDPSDYGVAFHRGKGDGTFEPAQLTGMYSVVRPTVGDVDGDGTDEVVVVRNPGYFGVELRAYSWVADVGWQQELRVVSRFPYQQLLGGDFNGDGLYDVAYSIANDIERRIDFWLGDREHPLATLQETHPPTDLFIQGVFDSDGDGRDELLAREYSPYRHAARLDLIADPVPRIVERWRIELPTDASARPPVTEDLDGDGNDDLQVSQGDLWGVQGYLLMRCSGAGCELVTRGVLGRLLVDARDFDGDGISDALIQQESEGLAILHGIGPLQFAEPLRISPQADGYVVSSGDLNGDGRLDLVTAIYSYQLYVTFFTIQLGNGDGSFSIQPGPPPLQNPRNDRALDIDGDGKLDLLTITAASEGFAVNIAWGRGDGSFEPWQALALPGYWFDIDFGDVDGDRALDMALAWGELMSPASVHTQLYLLVARRFVLGHERRQTTYNRVARLADVDGDGWPDLLTNKDTRPGTTDSAQELHWTRMIKGVPTTTQKFSNETFSSLSNPVTADLDGDAKADLLVYESSGENRVIHGDGGHGNTRTIWKGRSLEPYPQDMLRDVDGDGVLDLVAGRSPIRYRRGDGTGSFGPLEGPWIGGGNNAQFGDIDGSGTTDLVVPHYPPGQRAWVSQLASGTVASDDTSPPVLRLTPLPNLDYSTDPPAWDGAWRIAGRAIDDCRSARVTSIAMKLVGGTGLEPVSYRYAAREEIRIYRRSADGVTRVALFGPNEVTLRARLDQGRASGLALPRNHVMRLYEWRNNGETSPDDPEAGLVERVEFDGGLPARVDSYIPNAGIEFGLEGRDWLGKSAALSETFGQAKRRFCETEGAQVLACREP